MQTDRYNQLTNRHIAKLLDAIKEVMPLHTVIADKVKSEFHYLKEDILKEVKENGKKIY